MDRWSRMKIINNHIFNHFSCSDEFTSFSTLLYSYCTLMPILSRILYLPVPACLCETPSILHNVTIRICLVLTSSMKCNEILHWYVMRFVWMSGKSTRKSSLVERKLCTFIFSQEHFVIGFNFVYVFRLN